MLPIKNTRLQIGLSVLFILIGAIGVSSLAKHWLPALYWIIGHTLIWVQLSSAKAPPSSPVHPLQHIMLAGGSFVLLLLLVQGVCLPTFGWRGFLHLSNLSTSTWGFVLAIIPPAIGLWLISVRQLELLQALLPIRRIRLLLIIGAISILALTAWLPFFHIKYLPLALSLTVLALSIDIYLETNRTSMTWLLLWLFLISVIISRFCFHQSFRIDSLAHQAIALDIAQHRHPLPDRPYHLNFQWDTLSPITAQQRLLPEQRNIAIGTGHQSLLNKRIDWIYHVSSTAGFVIVGRPSGGIRPLLALTSFLFLAGLVYSLLLRLFSWLLGYPYQRWLLPLFGPGSLRIRIQLAFFGLIAVALLLVSWFTIHFFQDQSKLLLGEWLEQLLSLYVFLLIIAGTLGIFLANGITAPIVQIGQKLESTGLQNNQPLHWPKQDEIGKLVNNYNHMILELSNSADQLAASEREGAWREMAKQVAHEIKNPLTPMKLQLQQLLRLEKNEPERAREWSTRVAGSMIEQIDGLARIASAFSNFAQLPKAQASSFDLYQLVQSAYNLHAAAHPNIHFSLLAESCLVYADKDQCLRVLNNLITNAIQAMEHESTTPHIHVVLQQQHKKAFLQIVDNGTGIPDAIQDKIFRPNFTTKSSGMGLGLAMCKNIIEQAGGTISFESTSGGTTFSIYLPIKTIH